GTGLLLKKGTLVGGRTLDVNGTLNVSGTLRLSTNNTNMFVSENVTVSSPGVVQAGTGNVKFDGNLTYRDNVGGTNFGRLVIDPTTTLGSDLTADSVHILTGDTLVTAGYEMDVNGTNGRTTINVSGLWDMTGGTFTNTLSTVIFDGTSTVTSQSKNFWNVQIG